MAPASAWTRAQLTARRTCCCHYNLWHWLLVAVGIEEIGLMPPFGWKVLFVSKTKLLAPSWYLSTSWWMCTISFHPPVTGSFKVRERDAPQLLAPFTDSSATSWGRQKICSKTLYVSAVFFWKWLPTPSLVTMLFFRKQYTAGSCQLASSQTKLNWKMS